MGDEEFWVGGLVVVFAVMIGFLILDVAGGDDKPCEAVISWKQHKPERRWTEFCTYSDFDGNLRHGLCDRYEPEKWLVYYFADGESQKENVDPALWMRINENDRFFCRQRIGWITGSNYWTRLAVGEIP